MFPHLPVQHKKQDMVGHVWLSVFVLISLVHGTFAVRQGANPLPEAPLQRRHLLSLRLVKMLCKLSSASIRMLLSAKAGSRTVYRLQKETPATR